MAQKNETIYVNNYIPLYPKTKGDLHKTLLRNKYEKINNDKQSYFVNAKIVNFDIINHQCRRDPLEYSLKHYETVYRENLQRARKEDVNEFVGEAVKSRREDVNIERGVLNEHFKLDQKAIDFKLKNRKLFSSMHKKISKQ